MPGGLDPAEAAARLARHGPNRLPQAPGRGLFRRLLRQFQNPLIYVLLGSAGLAGLLQHLSDALVILAVVVVNAAIGFVQEGRAEKALDAIRGLIDPRASVLRGGQCLNIPADELVPGDIVLVRAGDRIAADLRLIRSRILRLDESALTGESMAVEKDVAPVAEDALLGDRASMAYAGTFVAAGQGTGVVVGTGMRTELGRISQLITSVESLKTPLLRQMDGLAKQLTAVVLIVSVISFFVAHLWRGYASADALMVVVGLAVAAIPEGLTAVMTITLAIGVQRMAWRNAIVRRLPAVETLGAVSVICSDKTGTLTRNEMTAREVVTAEGVYEVSGVGYQPAGEFVFGDRTIDVDARPLLMNVIRAGLLCNDAELYRREDQWHVDGDPMEGALVCLAVKAGLDPADTRRQFPRSDEIPFDSPNRWMATLHHRHDNGSFVLIKGAPERLLEICARERFEGGVRPLDQEAWHRAAERLAARGRRVLALAEQGRPGDQQALTFAEVGQDAVLLGLVGFIDPPRAEAITAVGECRTAGIRVVMITGDHAVTAQAIARELGLAAEPRVLAGHEIDALDDAGLRQAVCETEVFARTTPEHKLRLVEAMQANGWTVAMTGDGVNDAPALRRADVGVAMGGKGTEVARQAASMVLADDNFASIVAAVREGRTVYDNLMKVVGWTLPTNAGEAVIILLAILLDLALPITPVQILWVNMITAVALGLTLAFEPTEPGTMSRPPRAATQPILHGALFWNIAFVSVLFSAGAFGVFSWAERRGLDLATTQTTVVNTIVAMEIFYLFNVRYLHGASLTLRGVVGTPAVLMGVTTVVLGQLLFTYAPFMQDIFGSRPVALADGLVIVGVAVAMFLLVEVEKRLRRAWPAQAQP